MDLYVSNMESNGRRDVCNWVAVNFPIVIFVYIRVSSYINRTRIFNIVVY